MEALKKAIEMAGSQAKLAALINQVVPEDRHISSSAIGNWLMRGMVPPEWVLPVAEALEWKITPHELARWIYPHPDDGLPEGLRGKAA